MRFISWYVELSSAVERIRALQEMLQKKEETLEAMQAEVERLTIVSSRTFHTLQEDENWSKPTTTTWAAEFLLREGESREFLGSWIRSGAVHEAKKICKRERGMPGASIDSLPTETVAHIQSAGCNL
jgi:hypothetical protein